MPRRLFALALISAACIAAPLPAASQDKDPKPPPPEAAKKPPAKPEKPDSPPPPRRETPSAAPSGERPRADVPVSFPVDI
jgi:hypothetical protein